MVDVRISEKNLGGYPTLSHALRNVSWTWPEGDGHVYPPSTASKKISKESLKNFILTGKGVMPAFSHLSESERDADFTLCP